MIDISHACKITFVQTFEFFTCLYILAQSLYSHIPNFITNGWKHDVISHDWHHSCMHNHVCASIWVFLLIYILAQSLFSPIPNFITIGWKHIISHDWHHSCVHNHVCANIWDFYRRPNTRHTVVIEEIPRSDLP